MLGRHRLSSSWLGVFVLTKSNEGQALFSVFTHFPPKGWRAQCALPGLALTDAPLLAHGHRAQCTNARSSSLSGLLCALRLPRQASQLLGRGSPGRRAVRAGDVGYTLGQGAARGEWPRTLHAAPDAEREWEPTTPGAAPPAALSSTHRALQ